MKIAEIDREGAHFKVTWTHGAAVKSCLLNSRIDAESLAIRKIGATGCIISTLDMTAKQLAAHQQRKAAQAALAPLNRETPQ